jgi:hypothetical protein
VKVGFTDVVKGRVDATLEQRKESFHGVGVRFATHVFTTGVTHTLMVRLFTAGLIVSGKLIRRSAQGWAAR